MSSATADTQPKRKRTPKQTKASDQPAADGAGGGIRVPWAKNPRWIDTLVSELINDPALHQKLFSDSTETARRQDRSVAATTGKTKRECLG